MSILKIEMFGTQKSAMTLLIFSLTFIFPRFISVHPENRNVWHTKKRYDTFNFFIDFHFSPIYKADSGSCEPSPL